MWLGFNQLFNQLWHSDVVEANNSHCCDLYLDPLFI